jgi:flavoprotein
MLPDGTEINLQHSDSSGKEKVQCDLCHTLLALGPHRSLQYLSQHRGSHACKQAVQRNAIRETRSALLSGRIMIGCYGSELIVVI